MISEHFHTLTYGHDLGFPANPPKVHEKLTKTSRILPDFEKSQQHFANIQTNH